MMLKQRCGRYLSAIAACAFLMLCCPCVAGAQSAIDGFDPGTNGFALAFATQADGKILVGGWYEFLAGGSRDNFGRLNVDGSLDTAFSPHAGGGAVEAVAVQSNGQILIGGNFLAVAGVARRFIARLNPDGSLDTGFDPGADSHVVALAIQPDGKILVGGAFSKLGGGGTTLRSRIGRLNANGSIDLAFDPGANGYVATVVLQENGQILVGGDFTMLGGGGTGTTLRSKIGRLNATGSLDAAFDPGADGFVAALAVQPDGKIVAGGSFATLGGSGRSRIGRLNANGSLDLAVDPGANGDVRALAMQPDGKILVGGDFSMLGGGGTGTVARSRIARLHSSGLLDATFNPGTTNSSNHTVNALALQSDGKILVGGSFAGLGGGTGMTTRSSIGRLYADGSVDADLNPGASGIVYTVAVLANGKIMFGGSANAGRTIGRLHAGGAADPAFGLSTDGQVNALAVQPDGNVVVGGAFTQFDDYIGQGTIYRANLGRFIGDDFDFVFDPGVDGPVNAVAVQPDGKILVGGSFAILASQEENNLGRINADGSADTSFAVWPNGAVNAIALQPDGKILVGGAFTEIYDDNHGERLTRNHLARINADGSLDQSFDPAADGPVNTLAMQADGAILVGGAFSVLGDQEEINFGRLNAGGSPDASFAVWTNGQVLSMAAQTDGKIVVGGAFTALYEDNTGLQLARSRIGRVNADGSLDPSFDPGASNVVRALAVQLDGKLVVGGSFGMLGGGGTGVTPRSRIGRLTNTGAAAQRLRVSNGGSQISWARSAAGPEVWRVTLESSADGVSFTPLASPTRSAGGWESSGLSLPTSQSLYIRARGHYATGSSNGSGSAVESVLLTYARPSLAFTDAVLTASTSMIRAVHITELRSRIDALRIHFGLGAFPYGDGVLTIGITGVRLPHITDLRTALSQAYVAAGLAAPPYTDPVLGIGASIRAVHVQELRSAVLAIE